MGISLPIDSVKTIGINNSKLYYVSKTISITMPREPAPKRIILEKAIHPFGERGYHGITTGALATAANANEASLFQHFESNEGLDRAAITEVGSHTERILGKALLDIYATRKNRDPRQFAF